MPDTDLERQFKRLCRGLAEVNYREAFEAHRFLLAAGDECFPLIEGELTSRSWSHIRSAEEINLFTGLLSLANDISESLTHTLAREIRANGCSQSAEARLTSILSFSLTNFEIAKFGPLPLFISKALTNRNAITAHVLAVT